MRGFIEFIRQQGVIGLAIAFILGAAVGKVVASLVDDIVQPAIGMLFGNPDGLSTYKFYAINYGTFLARLVEFVIVAAVVYFIFKGLKLDRMDIHKEDKK